RRNAATSAGDADAGLASLARAAPALHGKGLVKRCLLRAALVTVWAWGTINAVSSAPRSATAFDRADSRYRRPRPVDMDDDALEPAVRAASGQPSSRIVAVTADRTGTKAFFGIRSVGKGHGEPGDMALVVRCPLAGDRVGGPEAVISLSTAEAL